MWRLVQTRGKTVKVIATGDEAQMKQALLWRRDFYISTFWTQIYRDKATCKLSRKQHVIELAVVYDANDDSA